MQHRVSISVAPDFVLSQGQGERERERERERDRERDRERERARERERERARERERERESARERDVYIYVRMSLCVRMSIYIYVHMCTRLFRANAYIALAPPCLQDFALHKFSEQPQRAHDPHDYAIFRLKGLRSCIEDLNSGIADCTYGRLQNPKAIQHGNRIICAGFPAKLSDANCQLRPTSRSAITALHLCTAVLATTATGGPSFKDPFVRWVGAADGRSWR